MLGGSLDRVLKTRRLDIRHYGSGLLSPVPPAAGARRRVRIQYDDRPPLARGLDRQRKKQCSSCRRRLFCASRATTFMILYTVLLVYMLTMLGMYR